MLIPDIPDALADMLDCENEHFHRRIKRKVKLARRIFFMILSSAKIAETDQTNNSIKAGTNIEIPINIKPKPHL